MPKKCPNPGCGVVTDRLRHHLKIKSHWKFMEQSKLDIHDPKGKPSKEAIQQTIKRLCKQQQFDAYNVLANVLSIPESHIVDIIKQSEGLDQFDMACKLLRELGILERFVREGPVKTFRLPKMCPLCFKASPRLADHLKQRDHVDFIEREKKVLDNGKLEENDQTRHRLCKEQRTRSYIVLKHVLAVEASQVHKFISAYPQSGNIETCVQLLKSFGCTVYIPGVGKIDAVRVPVNIVSQNDMDTSLQVPSPSPKGVNPEAEVQEWAFKECVSGHQNGTNEEPVFQHESEVV